MAIACLRDLTFCPEEDFKVPRLNSPITFSTFFCFFMGTGYHFTLSAQYAADILPLAMFLA